ncbi:hypothetical protein L289_0133 [Acinetobacter gerneri DSM 14967 = CIP 107464 = MTCC 9824]|uniref:Uncharacterized protein n=1 Tax=Acinetobacter gerneri DSM 14967 = CIP 107464 = MTCC 9824 TaxID=1120926 RepID=N8Y983_9GAMM|nr:hypothetical protein F960_02354 [Acinetobacter gerneri DSM 14967 = CIP 107464 = MTCC 9824]EPR85640.1 hypothetical protein L289_0133 [Acinetobacter gerneri DSM 14967 = CIP 107464 = MTCC 9824]
MRVRKENVLLVVFWKSLAVSIIAGIIVISITYLLFDYNKQMSTMTVNISYIKDIYSIIFAIFAPFIAIYLFSDWKEQHNKQIIADEAKKLLISIDKDIYFLANLKATLEMKDQKKTLFQEYDDSVSNSVRNFMQNHNLNDEQGYLVSELANILEFEKIRKEYSEVTLLIQNTMNMLIKSNVPIEQIVELLETFRKKFAILNKIYKQNIKKLIFA